MSSTVHTGGPFIAPISEHFPEFSFTKHTSKALLTVPGGSDPEQKQCIICAPP